MKKIVLFLFFLFAIKGFSQTYVSGNIKTNTTWTKANSPYILTGPVGVPAAYTLTIEPGVTVEKIAAGQGIIINGTLQCNGMETDSVIFITNAPPNIGDYYFLQFEKANLSNSSLRFISFHNENPNAFDIAAGVENPGRQTNPKNSGTLLVSRSTFNYGYSQAGGYFAAEAFNLDSCNFYATLIQSYYESENITISNSTVINTDLVRYPNSNQQSFRVVNCTVQNSLLDGINFDSSTVSGGKLFGEDDWITKIYNSTFKNVPIIGSRTNLEIVNSKFSIDNNAQLSDYPTYGSTIYLIDCATASITSSEFTALNNISCINLKDYSGYPFGDNVVHSSFNNCYDAVTVRGFSDHYETHVDSNYFYNVSRYDIVNLSTKDFSAIDNSYQLDPGQTIEDKIFDNNDNLSYGLVIYTPSAVVLPLDLINVAGLYTNGQVILKWQTASEVNTSKFIVQRLINGAYEDIGTVMAKGNTTNNYTFTPGSFNYGSNTYRLKMVDVDGQYKYSTSLSIDISSLPLKIKVYPNPATNYIVISHTEAGSNSLLQLVDMSGKVIKTVPVTNGDIQNKLNVADLAAGMYKIIWHNGNTIQSQTVMIQ